MEISCFLLPALLFHAKSGSEFFCPRQLRLAYSDLLLYVFLALPRYIILSL